MDFKSFDEHMRSFEKSVDVCIPDNVYMVARLDGHGFSKVTKRLRYKKPFDMSFNCLMEHVLKTLMEKSNLKIIYGYTQSDEISLLFAATEGAFGRKTRKYNSLLAGLASAAASVYLAQSNHCDFDKIVTFDCRIIPLPTIKDVCNYFVWRQMDSLRNSRNSYCYWTMLQEDKMSARAATSLLCNKDNEWKEQYLREHDIEFEQTPFWQRLGIGAQFSMVSKEAYNPIKNETTTCYRRQLEVLPALPVKEEYRNMIADILKESKDKE